MYQKRLPLRETAERFEWKASLASQEKSLFFFKPIADVMFCME